MKPFISLSSLNEIKRLLRKSRLNTVCEESRCPNIAECFSSGTATFMILGDRCTRSCTFCNVRRFSSGAFDPQEPERVAQVVNSLGLKYVVITSVTRDDLYMGGAFQFYETVKAIKSLGKDIKVEVLVPDFLGSRRAIGKVIEGGPDVFAHNLETVPRLYERVRRGANYTRSLKVLEYAKIINGYIKTKSSLILGLGETMEEVEKVMEDLRNVNCDILTIGQYYNPSSKHHPVLKFYTYEEFNLLEKMAYEKGFSFVFSGPNVRSSYLAHKVEAIL